LLQEPGVGKDLDPYVLGHLLELGVEFVADFDVPSHGSIMACDTYDFKLMSGLPLTWLISCLLTNAAVAPKLRG
jgi:hypothetical protein